MGVDCGVTGGGVYDGVDCEVTGGGVCDGEWTLG